jgi:hypothetical protein
MVEGLAQDDAEELLTEIAVQIGAATGQPMTWLARYSRHGWNLDVAVAGRGNRASAAGICWDRIRRARVRRGHCVLVEPDQDR